MVETVKLFISSPGDLQSASREPGKAWEPGARERVAQIAKKLNGIFKHRIIIKPVLWEEQYYSAHDTFQGQIEEAGACDVVVAIFKARLGSPLPASFPRHLPDGQPYPSGTAYEVLSAIEARKQRGDMPDIYVFRCSDSPNVKLDNPQRNEIEAQWEKLNNFFNTWFRTPAGEFTLAFQDYQTDDELIAKVETCLLQWLAKRGILPQGPVWDRRVLGSPFPGLSAFDAERETVFFGRELAIRQALTRLREGFARGTAFLLLIGASGSGKSSLLRAGLLPQLVLPGTVPEIDHWCQVIMVPGSDPFAALAAALLAEPTLGPQLRQGVFKTEALLTKQLKSEPMLATAPLHEALQRVARGKPARLALGIDQAERLFTETATAAAVSFAALVTALVNDGLCFVVMVLRSDAYAQFQTIEPFLALREAGASFDLVAPNQAELEEIVKRPLAACDPPLSFETIEGKSLASRLVTDTKGGDALPLLQMTLSRLYEAADERGDNVLRFADYRGMDAAVTDTANDVLATLHDASRAELPSLVTTLVRDIVTDPWTGAQVAVAGNFVRQNFIANKPSRAALVDAFIDRRLLTAEGETIRPTHEALLRIWPSAKAIIDETASLLRLRGALESRVVEWKAAIGAEKARHLDIPPSLLAGAQRLATLLPADLSADMLDFIQQASLAARNKHNAKLRLAWGTAIGGFASAAVGIVLCLWAEFESNKAQTSLQLATATLRSFAQIIGSVNNRDADSTTQTNNIDANIDNIAALYQSSPADAAALYLAAAQMRQLSPDSGTAYANKALAMLQSLHLANPHDPDITLDYDRGLIDRARAEAGSGIRNDAAIADFSAGIASLQAVLATNRIPETRRMIMLLLGHAEEDLGDLTVRIAQAETDSNKKTVDIAQAGAGYTQAATVFQIFSAENKGDPQGTAEQAWALNKSGDIANQQLQIATAASRYGQAADLLRGLGKQLAANPIWPQHLAIIDMNLGIIRLSQMDFYGAQTIFSSAYTEFSGLRDLASSQNVELQADVAWSQDFIGFANYLCAEQGSTTCLADAETVLRGAQEARTTLHQLAPGQLQLVDDLAHTNATLAAVQGLRDIAAHDETGAAKDFEQAASLTASILREGNWEVWRLADFEDRQGEAAAALGDAQTATADFTKAAQTLASQLCAADTANCMAPTPIILTLNTRISNDLSHINGPRPLQ